MTPTNKKINMDLDLIQISHSCFVMFIYLLLKN